MSHLKICVQRGENMYTMLIAQLSVSNLKRLFQVRLVLSINAIILISYFSTYIACTVSDCDAHTIGHR